MSTKRLENKQILITGASSGIGYALSMLCASEGANVIGLARNENNLKEIKKIYENNFDFILADLKSKHSVEAIKTLNKFDIVVCNAGRGLTKMPLETTEDDILDMIQLNLFSVMRTVEGALPKMLEHGHGQIIIVGSILGRVPYAPWRAAYNVSKAALLAIATGWRQELEPKGITVTVVNPGLTSTGFQSSANPDNKPMPSGWEKLKTLPSSQAQTAEEVAEIIVETIINPKDEVYTRTEIAAWMVHYFAQLSEGRDILKDLYGYNK